MLPFVAGAEVDWNETEQRPNSKPKPKPKPELKDCLVGVWVKSSERDARQR